MRKGTERLALLALLLCSPLPASAEPDPGRATTISLVSTLAPCALGGVAFVNDSPELGWSLFAARIYVGPASGYFYGGLPGRGLGGIGYRAALSLIVLWGVGTALDENSDSQAAPVAVVVGAAGVAGSAVYDIATLGRRVRARNERAVTLSPWRSAEGVAGLALRTSF